MDRRQCILMRRFFGLTLSMIEIGEMDIKSAAAAMKRHGVPLPVALRTLTRRAR